MIKRYIKFPYEKVFVTKASYNREVDGITYALPEESIIFLGNEHMPADEYKVNSATPKTIKVLGDTCFSTESESLKLSINYKRRLDYMQQNLGNALVRLYVDKSTNISVLDYKIDDDVNKIYLDTDDISYSSIDKIEELANYAIAANLLVKVYELSDKIEIRGIGPISYDGPCLRRTGETALIKISEIKKENGKIVLYINCGERALKDYIDKTRLIQNIESILFIDDEKEILKEIKSLKSSGENLKEKNEKIEKELNLETVKEYKKLATTVEGINYIYKIIRNGSLQDLKLISNAIMDDYNYVQIYGIPNGDLSQIIVSRSKNLNINLKSIFDKIAPKYAMTGTGNMYSVQGTVKSQNLAGVMENFLIEVKNLNPLIQK